MVHIIFRAHLVDVDAHRTRVVLCLYFITTG